MIASLRRSRRPAATVSLPPPFLLTLLYVVLATVGTALLMTPWAQARPFGWGDAAFTAVSAVTVTGLVVLDNAADLTMFGQGVLIMLFQFGGMGLMAFAVLVMSALGMPVGLSGRLLLRADLGQTSLRNLVRLAGTLMGFSLLVQLFGVAALAVAFVPEMGWAQGLWFSAFHTASAFNNAGFAIEADSLARWAGDPVVSLAVPAMFILGGLGFSVVADVLRNRSWRGLGMHSKMMLSGTAALLALSTAGFAILEWRNPATLGALPDHGVRVLASFFQAATTRTAGFSTIDFAEVHDSTALMTISLMLIGGGPGSTAGGVKVTTFVIMLLAVVAFLKRRQSLHAFGRSIGPDEVLKVLALTMMAVLVVMISIFALLITQDGDFLDLTFEAVSAFGTVGLSRGATGDLDATGRVIVMALMLLGRVGPLTLGYFLATRAPVRIRYPGAQVYLG
ncbi:MAG: TrkH family potassium uptake protein [Rubrimonas sp.]